MSHFWTQPRGKTHYIHVGLTKAVTDFEIGARFDLILPHFRFPADFRFCPLKKKSDKIGKATADSYNVRLMVPARTSQIYRTQ